MSGLEKRQPFEPRPLRVGPRTNERQYEITRSFDGPGTWEEKYVSFSGYFGAHGPHVFAAAPEMLEALNAFPAEADFSNAENFRTAAIAWFEMIARPAIAKAEGQS